MPCPDLSSPLHGACLTACLTLEVLCFSIQLNFIDRELCAVVKPHQKERSNAAFGNGNGVIEFDKTTRYVTALLIPRYYPTLVITKEPIVQLSFGFFHVLAHSK